MVHGPRTGWDEVIGVFISIDRRTFPRISVQGGLRIRVTECENGKNSKVITENKPWEFDLAWWKEEVEDTHEDLLKYQRIMSTRNNVLEKHWISVTLSWIRVSKWPSSDTRYNNITEPTTRWISELSADSERVIFWQRTINWELYLNYHVGTENHGLREQ
jgi:hypothetical protein